MSGETTVHGIPASAGVAGGPAHWVRSEADLERFQPGSVLLARMTSPDWGSAYQRCAAVVTIEGGMLCHAAIVAREEGVPAVVGVGPALESVPQGATLLVDGTYGSVQVRAVEGTSADGDTQPRQPAR